MPTKILPQVRKTQDSLVKIRMRMRHRERLVKQTKGKIREIGENHQVKM